jgi:acyl-CoA reductase-like NAD-dependent aldehyde dehydrogenase
VSEGFLMPVDQEAISTRISLHFVNKMLVDLDQCVTPLSRYKTVIDGAPPSPGAATTPKDLNMTYVSVNPFDGKTLKTFAEMTDAALETALATATEAFETWRHLAYAERAKIIDSAAGLLIERRDEMAHTMTLDMGKRIGEARG